MIDIYSSEDLERAANEYFSINYDNKEQQHLSKETTNEFIGNNTPPQSDVSHLTADGNIDELDKLGEELRQLFNILWGTNWGTISPDSCKGDDSENIILPQINYSMNLREVSKGTSPKPVLIDTIDEVVNGIKTGESVKVFRQSFDCIVEFNIFASTSKDCRELASRFEEAMMLYAGILKRIGVSELFFLKEVPAKYSLSYTDAVPMKCLYFFVRLERIKTIRTNQIKEITLKLQNVAL